MTGSANAPPPRLLFLPGAGGSPGFWRPLGDRLPAGWEKRYFGWPGLGDQPHDPAVTGLGDLVAMVERELGDRPADLLAQSMGGVVAMSVAIRNPGRVRRMVLSVTSGGVDAVREHAADWREGYRREHPDAAAWITEDRTDLTREIPRVACPTLLIWGDADPISSLAVGERLRALMPDARLHVVPGGGHDLVETRAGEVAEIVRRHLE